MRYLAFTLKTRLSLVAGLIACAVVVLAAPPAQADTISTVAGGGSPADGLGDGGAATGAQLRTPAGVAVTADGGYLIAEQSRNRVRKVSAGGTITTVAGGGSLSGTTADGGPATSAALNGVWGIDALPDGGFLVVEHFGHRVRHVSAGGIITTVAGTGTQGFSGDGGPAIAAALRNPIAVSALADGSFLIADNGNHRVRKVSGGTITTVAGAGTAGFSGDGGLATSANINSPRGVDPLGDGGFLITGGDHRIRKVDAFGLIQTVAGTGTGGVSADGGQAIATDLAGPTGIEDEGGGRFVFGDQFSNRARRVGADGVIRTVAGNGTGGFSGDGFDATAAQLNGATDVAIVDDGYLVVDIGNNRIRKVTLSDTDNDGTYDRDDAFPSDPSETEDSDGDGVGDNADAFDNDPTETTDSDSDGVGDNADAFDNDPTETTDSDSDGVGDNADAFDNDPTETTDSDLDGVGDNGDNCPTESNADQANLDIVSGDTLGDACDPDIDGDGVANGDDWAPRDATESKDTDGDNVGDNADRFPTNAAEWADADSDGAGDNGDNCRTDANESQADLDSDGTGDACDSDIDGDGAGNADDAFPFDPNESSDSDGDGIGDNGDRFQNDPNESADTDNDGIGDGADNCREQSNADQADQDGDGTGDVCDSDVDGDSVANGADNCERKANQDQVDRDEDGTGDACDSTPRPTAASICDELTANVVSSTKYATLSSTKQAAVRESLGNVCASIEKISSKLNPQQKAVLVRLQRLSVKAFAQDWLTIDQAAKLDRLIANM